MNRLGKRLGLIIGGLTLLKLSCFTVDETQYALVTQFGRIVRTVTTAGLKFKWPWQGRRLFDRRLQVYDVRPAEALTEDKKNLVVDAYVCWHLEDPEKFLKSVTNITGAELRLLDTVWSALAAAIGQVPLEGLLYDETKATAEEPSPLQVDEMLAEVTKAVDQVTRQKYGLRVVDVRLKRLNFPEQNKQSVFARMRAERERMARQYRAEGEEQAMTIRAEADKEKEKILSEAYREAEKIKGEAEAEATRIYSAAHSADPQFYKLVRTLEAYRKVLDDKTTAILSADSEMLRLLTRGREAGQGGD
ncbi:MAG TPA: protease modulator HflC [Armatimonadetes bacterium]|nr:protease modulator HflC [Armatimonadota bacterium]